MQYLSITIPKSFMGGIFPYLYYFFVNIVWILTLESHFYFYFFHVRLWGTTKEALLHMQFDLRLSIVNYLLIIMQQKL
jgi:hypothetical protein